jgi:hypothetical protein
MGGEPLPPRGVVVWAMTDNPLPETSSAGIAPPITVTAEEVRQFAEAVGLAMAAPDRCSTIFMFDLYVRAFFPVPGDPRKIVAEIRALEGLGRSVGTKPAEAFKHPPLRGLWKKHYLVGGLDSLARNIKIGFGRAVQRSRLGLGESEMQHADANRRRVAA